jgi:hypothetical protein
MSLRCLLGGCDDSRLSWTDWIICRSRGDLCCAGAGATDDTREVDGVQRPKSFLTQHELVW